MIHTASTTSPSLIEVDGITREIFFLRGHMRSGTNWACTLLNLHPRICCVGEHHFERLANELLAGERPRTIVRQDAQLREAVWDGVREMVRGCMRVHAQRHPGATMIGDRTPAPITDLLPGARVIDIVRDGRDVLVSRVFHSIRVDGEGSGEFASHSAKLGQDPEYFEKQPQELLSDERIVRRFARRWADVVRESRGFIARADAGEVDASVLQVSYESLHEHTEQERARMYAFLGLDPTEALPLSTQATPGYSDGSTQSFYRSGTVGDWKKFFTADASRWFNEEAGDVLVGLGYEKDTHWSRA
ncbi:MAG: sulfotransferase [Phycisphaerales bacterium]